jgi:leader peptidase (prepilin peptidase)/N-methyltransferase
MPFYFLLLSLLAGWLVNLAADTLPMRRDVRQTWFWPLWVAPGLMPCRLRLAMASETSALRPRRTQMVWWIAWVIGWVAYQRMDDGLSATILASQAWFLLAVAVIDLEHRLVLNRMLGWALPLILLTNWLTSTSNLRDALMGGMVAFAFFLVLNIVWPGGMGMGDVKLAGVVGLMLGLSSLWLALWVSVIVGGLVGLAILLISRFQRRQTMAYAPYLVLGAWTALYWNAPQWQFFLEKAS